MSDRELMEAVYRLLTVGVVVGFVILAIAASLMTIGMVATRRAARYEDSIKATLTEVAELLPLVKAWAMSARTGASDARQAVTEMKNGVMPDAERHVIEEVRKVPQQTAEKVVEKLDEFKRLILPPALATLGMMSSVAFATAPLSAADDLRERNAAIALEWAQTPDGNPQ